VIEHDFHSSDRVKVSAILKAIGCCETEGSGLRDYIKLCTVHWAWYGWSFVCVLNLIPRPRPKIGEKHSHMCYVSSLR